MLQMFRDTSNMRGELNFDTRNVEDMSGMFVRSGSTLDLSGWSVKNVKFCNDFCARCGMPRFEQCHACNNATLANSNGLTVCGCALYQKCAFRVSTYCCASVISIKP